MIKEIESSKIDSLQMVSGGAINPVMQCQMELLAFSVGCTDISSVVRCDFYMQDIVSRLTSGIQKGKVKVTALVPVENGGYELVPVGNSEQRIAAIYFVRSWWSQYDRRAIGA